MANIMFGQALLTIPYVGVMNMDGAQHIHAQGAARIFLCVTEVRAERAADITEYDAMREGFEAQLRFTKVEVETFTTAAPQRKKNL